MQFHSRKIQFLSEEILPKNIGKSTKNHLIDISGDYNIKYYTSRTRINGTTGGTVAGNIQYINHLAKFKRPNKLEYRVVY